MRAGSLEHVDRVGADFGLDTYNVALQFGHVL